MPLELSKTKKFPLTRSGMTARMILAATPRHWHERARWVSLSALKAQPAETGFNAFTCKARSTRNDDGTPRRGAPQYKVTITQINMAGHVKVDCECLAHPFWGGEVSLYMRNAADIIRSNGRPPRVRNPTMQPIGCKHITAALKALLQTGRLR